MRCLIFLITFGLLSLSAKADEKILNRMLEIHTDVEDTKENRAIQAFIYMKIMPMWEMMEVMWQHLFKGEPYSSWSPNVRKGFLEEMKTIVESDEMQNIFHEGLVETYTTAELRSLNVFYLSMNGKVIMKKMEKFISLTTPRLQAMVAKRIPEVTERILKKKKLKDQLNPKDD